MTVSTVITGGESEVAERADKLDAAWQDIDRWSMPQRRSFLDLISDRTTELVGERKWCNLAGVIDFFDSANWGAPGTWVSVVNAVVLEGVEAGLATALDPKANDFGNPGAREWRNYLIGVTAGQLRTTKAESQAWFMAKEVGTDYGVAVARTKGLSPNPVEERFLAYAEAYNWLKGNRAILDLLVANRGLIHKSLENAISPEEIDQLFTAGDAEMTFRVCRLAHSIAQLEPATDLGRTLRFLMTGLPTPLCVRPKVKRVMKAVRQAWARANRPHETGVN